MKSGYMAYMYTVHSDTVSFALERVQRRVNNETRWQPSGTQGVPGGMDKIPGECSLC
jgi:hypothetical protein